MTWRKSVSCGIVHFEYIHWYGSRTVLFDILKQLLVQKKRHWYELGYARPRLRAEHTGTRVLCCYLTWIICGHPTGFLYKSRIKVTPSNLNYWRTQAMCVLFLEVILFLYHNSSSFGWYLPTDASYHLEFRLYYSKFVPGPCPYW